MTAIGALLLCSCLGLLRPGAGQPFLRLRPSPSDNLPVKDIVEHPDPEYDPKEQDLDERTLRKKLGSHFDPGFMAVAVPGPVNASAGAEAAAGRARAAELRRLERGGPRLRVGKKARRKVLQWLWAYTYCPVLYTWKDLGVRFWPRYIKEGNCFAEKSCSLPEGMFCKPVKSVTKTFLRWHCQGWSSQKYCTWIPVQYPLISECKCSC
ncbi:noggin-2-like [Coturnix japonica]|uniref:Noggin n=1 Tax=Coturnix japonica TaxID=93934 RepID=A0A8C2YFR5_COTJA|nr:noggin-2-like [Coturnix japonica]